MLAVNADVSERPVGRRRHRVVWMLGLLLAACGGGGGGGSGDSADASDTEKTCASATASPPSNASPLPARAPVITGTGFFRVETPTPWDYRIAPASRSACRAGEGKTYAVGPGQAYSRPRDVPWLSLVACDQVLIHYRAEPYTDIVFLGVRGEPGKFITIKGVPGPKGERPVFDGSGAQTPRNTGFNQYYDGEGMIVIGRPTTGVDAPYGYKPGYLHITGLHIRNVRPPARYKSLAGATTTWRAFSSGIYANPAENLVVSDNEINDNGVGLFVNSIADEAQQSRKILVTRNYFHGNGQANNASLHNAYTEAVGTIYEYNYFGRPANGTLGDNIKERSAGVIFRYNYIEGGVHSISLRDPQSNADFEAVQRDAQGELLVKNAFVYSNIFVLRGDTDNDGIMIGHGDGSFGDGKELRYGHLYFYSNKVVAQYDYQQYDRKAVVLFELLNTRASTTVHAMNNLFYTQTLSSGAGIAPFSLFYWHGKADFAQNWINVYTPTLPGQTTTDGGLAVGSKFNGKGLGGLTPQSGSPGLTNIAKGNFTDQACGPFTMLKAALPAAIKVRGLVPAGKAVQKPFARP